MNRDTRWKRRTLGERRVLKLRRLEKWTGSMRVYHRAMFQFFKDHSFSMTMTEDEYRSMLRSMLRVIEGDLVEAIAIRALHGFIKDPIKFRFGEFGEDPAK